MHFLFDRARLQARRASFLSLSLGPITDIHPPFPVFATPKNSIKSLTPSDALAKEHYADLSARPFYPSLVKYITSGTPVVAMVWEGKDVIRQGVSFGSFFWFVKGKEKTKPPKRRIVGATNPLDADAGSVRGQYAVSVGRNLIHASDAFESATKEIGLWFAPEELSEYEPIAWVSFVVSFPFYGGAWGVLGRC